MTIAAQKLTIQDFLKLPNIEASPAWELVNGIALLKPMPTLYHSRLQKRIASAIDAIDSPYEAFPELRCILSQNSVVPDVAVIRRDRLPSGNEPLQGAPDWTIEILSPDQSTTKLIAKIQLCLESGSKLGWLIDPQELVAIVFLPDRPLSLLTGDALLPVLPHIPLELTVDRVFSWLN
jgi:Uma2 family endonuclease